MPPPPLTRDVASMLNGLPNILEITKLKLANIRVFFSWTLTTMICFGEAGGGGEVCWRREAADIDLPGTRESPIYSERFTSVGAEFGFGGSP